MVLPVQTASQWDCQGQRKIQLSITNTDRTIKLYQSEKCSILYNWLFQKIHPQSSLHHWLASSWPISFCQPTYCNTSVLQLVNASMPLTFPGSTLAVPHSFSASTQISYHQGTASLYPRAFMATEVRSVQSRHARQDRCARTRSSP